MMRIFTLLFACLLLAAPRAFAADPFTVAGISVDATARTAIEAQTQAIQEGQLRAANQLIERLTLESERFAKPLPELTPDVVGRMIRALEVGQEQRSANRYLGKITVAFNPSQVQQFLRENELTLVSSQARERLVIVTGQSGLRGTSGRVTLSSALADPRLSYSLTPLRPALGEDMAFLSANPSEDELKELGQKYGLNQVLLIAPGGTVTDIALDTGFRQSYFIPGANDPVRFADNLITRLEADWKRASAVVADEIVSSPVSVLYTSHRDWIALQDAINTAAQIKGARLDALSKDGALMTITYGGDIARLSTELGFKGVMVEQDPELGLVFRRR